VATILITDCIHLPVNKIQAIKALRTATNLGLKEAKDAVEGLPYEYEVPFYDDVDVVAQGLIAEGFQIRWNNSASTNNLPVEAAFKNFLIALVNAGEYDEVIRFIKVKKTDTTGRRLEPL
jgi:hypothetical protein